MAALLSLVGLSAAVFVATNVDDLFLLAVFFADPHLRPRAVVAGQFLGIAALVAASSVAALAALAVPDGYTGLLGLLPLALGLHALARLVRRRGGAEEEAEEDEAAEARLERRTHSQALAVAGVTVANGGDNLGVYIPLFAKDPGAIAWHALVFAVLTGLWCLLGHALVRQRVLGDVLRRSGHVLLPLVLLLLGLVILWDARVLLG
jgi:cadmium resistance protein CadD (predicted permease)